MSDIDDFLRIASHQKGITPNELLREVFHIHPESWYSENIFPHASATFIRLFKLVDQGMRERNPGLHYVDRSTYLGYRREQSQIVPAYVTKGQRSQIFACIVKGVRNHPKIVMPVEPENYSGVLGVRNLTGKGHHGVGFLEYDVIDEDSIHRLFHVFDEWLNPKIT